MNKIGLIVGLCLAITSAFAEPPRHRQRQFARQEMEANNGDEGTAEGTTEKSGPYPASGWKPPKQQLTLPQRQQRQQQTPNTLYGAPPQKYGPPATEYGPPQEESTTTMNVNDASEANEITEEPESENVDIDDVPAQVNNPAKDVQSSLFYVQVPRQPLVYVPVAQPAQRNGLLFSRLQVQPQPFLTTNQIILPGQAYSYSAQYQTW